MQLAPSNHPRRVCLYFGSFNPIHIGHMSLATYAVDSLGFDEVWLLLSPLNPQKSPENQLPKSLRAGLIKEAISGNERIILSLLEYDLPLPHYTVRSLRALSLLYPKVEFSLLIGGDNYQNLASWYEYERILQSIPLYVYPRPGYDMGELAPSSAHYCWDAPLMEVSSSQIREAAHRGEDLSRFLPNPERWAELSATLSQPILIKE